MHTFVLLAALATLMLLLNSERMERALAFVDAAVIRADTILDAFAGLVLMATGIATASANSMLNAYLRGTDYPGNAAVWVKLHTGDPGAAGTANAAGNTTRQQASFAAAAGGAAASNADILWTNVSTGETYSHVSFWTAAAAGTFLGSDDLDVAKTVAATDDFIIKSGTISMTLTPIAA